MKKFERLPAEKRKEEIMDAALKLFNEKGFKSVTMENIVSEVSLSKGGVYRIYPSTCAVLSDIMISGMHLRNAFYEEKTRELLASNKKITLEFLVEMIADSLFMYPEISSVYVEFLWEKRRNQELSKLYEEINKKTIEETNSLIKLLGAEEILQGKDSLKKLTDIMNSFILSMKVLNLQDYFKDNKKALINTVISMLNC